jgi:hypothetical protein
MSNGRTLRSHRTLRALELSVPEVLVTSGSKVLFGLDLFVWQMSDTPAKVSGNTYRSTRKREYGHYNVSDCHL